MFQFSIGDAEAGAFGGICTLVLEFQFSIGDARRVCSAVWHRSAEHEFQFSIGDARVEGAGGSCGQTRRFNSLLEMRHMPQALPAQRPAEEFQFSIGDAVPRGSYKLYTMTREVSILYWRCAEGWEGYTRYLTVSIAVSILYWRCKLKAIKRGRWQLCCFNSLLEMPA